MGWSSQETGWDGWGISFLFQEWALQQAGGGSEERCEWGQFQKCGRSWWSIGNTGQPPRPLSLPRMRRIIPALRTTAGWQVKGICVEAFFCLFNWSRHHSLSGHEFEQTAGGGDGHGSLACCSPWVAKSQTWLSDWTTNNSWLYNVVLLSAVQQSDSVIHVYVLLFFSILVYQIIEYSFLCYMVGPCYLPILHMLVCIC